MTKIRGFSDKFKATIALEALLGDNVGLLEEIVGRFLNHTPLSITGKRNTRPSLDALRPSMEIACTELSRRKSS